MTKKSYRLRRKTEREQRVERYLAEDSAMETFFSCCKPILSPEDWDFYYVQTWLSGAEDFAFVWTLEILAKQQTPIEPDLRKAIDGVLKAFVVTRGFYPILRQLNYSYYWKTQYGLT